MFTSASPYAPLVNKLYIQRKDMEYLLFIE